MAHLPQILFWILFRVEWDRFTVATKHIAVGKNVRPAFCLLHDNHLCWRGTETIRVPGAVQRPPGEAKRRPVRCAAEPGPTSWEQTRKARPWAPVLQRIADALRCARGTDNPDRPFFATSG